MSEESDKSSISDSLATRPLDFQIIPAHPMLGTLLVTVQSPGPAELVLEIEVRERLPVGVGDDERPHSTRAAGSGAVAACCSPSPRKRPLTRLGKPSPRPSSGTSRIFQDRSLRSRIWALTTTEY